MTRSDMPSGNRKLHTVGYYKLTGRVLGKGNFARVEEATHTFIYRKVAVKIIDTSQIKEEYVARNLEREARILARLSHPNIVFLYETMRSESLYYMVTELASGGDLCSYIKNHKNGHLDEKLARNFGCQLISAIIHMHKRGVVHRDLKMENIMLDGTREHIKIVDFGLSNIWDSDHALKTHCGSPEYAAPELFIVGQKYGPEVDLWSLGVVLYGMVTGSLPFLTPKDKELTTSDKRRHLVSQINRGLTSYQSKALIGCSSDLKNLIAGLLVPNVRKRLSLREIKFHPWVLGPKKLKNVDFEFKQLTEIQRNSIVKRVAGVLNTDPSKVETELSVNKFGTAGGIYNVMAHLQLLVSRDNSHMMLPSQSSARIESVRSQTAGLTRLYPMPRLQRAQSATQSEYSPKKQLRQKSIQQIQPTKHHTVNVGFSGAHVDDQVKGVTRHNAKSGTPLKYILDNRSKKSNQQPADEHRTETQHRNSSAQLQGYTTRLLRDRPNSYNLTVSSAVRTVKPACKLRTAVTNSSVTSTSSGSNDLVHISHRVKKQSYVMSSKTNPGFDVRLLNHSVVKNKP